MHERRAGLLAFVVSFCLFALIPIGLHAQSATTGLVQGQVADPTGAVIPGATVTLTSKATAVATTTTTDATGRFAFPAVNPGDYTLRVTATGFQSYVVSKVTVQITKSYTYPVQLKVGTTSQTVTVTEVLGAELQTTNASIGAEIGGNAMLRLPSTQRNVTSLLGLQPAVTPMIAGDDVMGGQVAGAMADQTTFLVDGGDATSDLEATNSYASVPGQPQPSPFIAVNVESTQEFRVTTASPTSSFSRSQGGQVSIVSKSGTNAYHGSAYEYYTGSTLGANSWENNRLGIHRPHKVNNRFGFTFGGAFPKMKDRLWFFGNYEGRRFRQSGSIATDVPSALARQGILQFRDAAGNLISYNLATSTACGDGTQACDPRGIGLDPVIADYWKNLPLPNDLSGGDGINSQGYRQSYALPANEDYGLLRLDLKINPRWKFFTTYRQQKLGYLTNSQFTIIPGQQGIVSNTPVQPRFATFMLTGQIGSHFTTQTHGSWMRDWWAWGRQAPSNPPGVPDLGGALQVSGEGRTGNGATTKPFADPTNYNTQNARARVWAGKDWYLAEDDSWLHGNHNISFGGAWYFWNIIHLRTDDVLGGLTSAPIYWVGSRRMSSGSYVYLDAANRPVSCTTDGQADCLPSSQLGRWESMYAAMLGMVDHSSQVATRDGNFNPNPLGTPLVDQVHVGSFYTYVQDMWQIRPSLTLTYGLSYGAQFPPREINGKQAMQLYSATGQPVQDMGAYFAQREQALNKGLGYPSNDEFNVPSFNFAPIGSIPGFTRPVNTYWGQLGPRFAIAWQPGFSNKIFGNHQTVIRGGYSILWDRTNAVGLVMTPLLGTGLAQLVGCDGPTMSGTCSGGHTYPDTAFRIGIDGNSVPNSGPGLVTATAGYPITPVSPFGSTYGFNLDPAYKPAWSHNVSFDLQRSFPNNWLIDVGYIGRFSRNLENGADSNASDMFAKDPISGQTLGQAFDNVSTFLRNGGDPAATPAQPYFENMAAPGTAGAAFCQTTYGTSCTAQAAIDDGTDFIYGSLGSLMEFEYNFLAQRPLDPMQFVLNFWNWSGGWANYNAGFVTATKSFSNGLQLNFSYTWSHALSTQAQLGQQYIIYGDPSPFQPSTGYGTSIFDRRHVFNVAWYYELPFGKGKMFSTGNGVLDRIVGGWYTSGIWTYQSGQPLCIAANGDYGDIGSGANNQTCAVTTSNLFGSASRHNGIAGSGGVGVNGDPAPPTAGSGINIFADPAAVFNGLSRPLLTQVYRPFQPNLTEPGNWNVDLSLGKNIAATERTKVYFTADFFNAFNRFQVGNPSLSMTNPAAFGVVTSQANDPRTVQLGLRVEF
jgi:hypothetical protein